MAAQSSALDGRRLRRELDKEIADVLELVASALTALLLAGPPDA